MASSRLSTAMGNLYRILLVVGLGFAMLLGAIALNSVAKVVTLGP
jgi:hypothetical protein